MTKVDCANETRIRWKRVAWNKILDDIATCGWELKLLFVLGYPLVWIEEANAIKVKHNGFCLRKFSVIVGSFLTAENH